MGENRARITVKIGQTQRKTPPAKEEVKDKPSVLGEEQVQTPLNKVGEDKPLILEQAPEHKQEPFISDTYAARHEVAAGGGTDDNTNFFGPKYIPADNAIDYESKWKIKKSKSRLRGTKTTAKETATILAAAIGAVTLGMLFGFLILLFFQAGLFEQSGMEANVTLTTNGAASDSSVNSTIDKLPMLSDGSSNSSLDSAELPVMLMVPSQKYYVIQAGVFHDQASAKPLIEKLNTNGWPNAFFGEKPQFLFLGLGVQRDHVLAMADQFEGLDIFIKEINEPQRTTSVSLLEGATLKQEEFHNWSKAEHQLIETLGKGVAEGLTAKKLSEGSMNAITSAHRNYLQKGRELLTKFPDSSQVNASRLLNDYTKGVTAMERYHKQPDEGYLWQTQQALMDAHLSKQIFYQSF